MERRSQWAWPLWVLWLSSSVLLGQEATLTVGDGLGLVGDPLSVPLSVSSQGDIEGLQIALDWDGALAEPTGFTPSAIVASGDLLFVNFLPSQDFFAIVIAIDDDNTEPLVIPAGTNELGSLDFTGLAVGTTAIEFRDGVYTTDAASPPFDNIFVAGGGLSIDQSGGLTLENGSLTFEQPPPRFSIADGARTREGESVGCAEVFLESEVEVAGVQVSLAHDPNELQLTTVDRGNAVSDANFAEFFGVEILPTGGTVGVIFDAESPFDPTVRMLGAGIHSIAFYCYRAIDPPTTPGEEKTTPLTFVDGLGSPPKENLYVTELGESSPIDTVDNIFSIFVGIVDVPTEDCTNGIDDDGNGLVDNDDPACQQGFACGVLDENGEIVDPVGTIGGAVEVCFFVKSPAFDDPETKGSETHIQGFSMAIDVDCALESKNDLDISDTILEAIGAEFVSTQRDNDPNDGDGCELVIGILLDALPPFEGQTIPPLDDFQKIGCIDFCIADDESLCDVCLPLQFRDGVDGTEDAPVKNLISVNNRTAVPTFNDCNVCVETEPEFVRGDCNFSGEPMGMAVNIADAASVVSFLFPTFWVSFEPPCLDGCDCNDDGRVDLADTFCILNFLFTGGSFPPAPGPGFNVEGRQIIVTGAGEDPTHDVLGCDAGIRCQ